MLYLWSYFVLDYNPSPETLKVYSLHAKERLVYLFSCYKLVGVYVYYVSMAEIFTKKITQTKQNYLLVIATNMLLYYIFLSKNVFFGLEPKFRNVQNIQTKENICLLNSWYVYFVLMSELSTKSLKQSKSICREFVYTAKHNKTQLLTNKAIKFVYFKVKTLMITRKRF